MRSWWGQAVRAPVAIEAGTVGWEARLGGGQTQATMVAVMEAAGGGSVAAGGALKTLGAVTGEAQGWSHCSLTGPPMGAGLALAGVCLHFTPLACVSRQTLAVEGIGQRVTGCRACGVAGLVQTLVYVPLTAQPHKAWRAGAGEASRFGDAGPMVVTGLGLTSIGFLRAVLSTVAWGTLAEIPTGLGYAGGPVLAGPGLTWVHSVLAYTALESRRAAAEIRRATVDAEASILAQGRNFCALAQSGLLTGQWQVAERPGPSLEA